MVLLEAVLALTEAIRMVHLAQREQVIRRQHPPRRELTAGFLHRQMQTVLAAAVVVQQVAVGMVQGHPIQTSLRLQEVLAEQEQHLLLVALQ